MLASSAESLGSHHVILKPLVKLSGFLSGVTEDCVQVKFLKFLEMALGHVNDQFA